MKNKIFIFLFVFIVLIGCKSQINQVKIENNNSIPIKEHTIQSILWQQNAAEYKALTYQAYNLAKLQLENILTKNEFNKPYAIVTDIDETLLDNSPYSGKQVELDENYSTLRWTEWVQKKKANAIPGAVAFFNYAKSKGVEVFYVSNRSSNQTKETIENLKSEGFPFADETHVILKTNSSEKETRRNHIRKTHQIVLFLGDNLSDFSSIFENRNTKQRNKSVDSLKTFFGRKFIVLPNPIYGDWETKGILEGKYNWSNFQKDSIRRKKIISY
ncbi:5'-nucleotidase, lipoprotein e(P4) family [Polaribacter sp. MSW13]|uniref:5'-nucleotidase, lipoprotein e(P4) family n=1 Tax=Polaribacter marinus TaxID=2916838 RepID=A0A9X2AL81_9FLAO|nr:5'-nucleotidase, lipoprotein e(P4) family [Polaribacter marinus]MCI2227609.1 5'-nucleotidase, lipoprotein e(P4) family [Polaribacter marinus]